MSEREKFTSLLNGKQQIADGSIDELLLDDELRAKIAMIEKLEARLTKLENSLGNIDDADFVSVLKAAMSSGKS